MDKDKSFALLDAFDEAGGNFIDTANAYQASLRMIRMVKMRCADLVNTKTLSTIDPTPPKTLIVWLNVWLPPLLLPILVVSL